MAAITQHPVITAIHPSTGAYDNKTLSSVDLITSSFYNLAVYYLNGLDVLGHTALNLKGHHYHHKMKFL